MQKNHFLVLKKWKNTGSAQLCTVCASGTRWAACWTLRGKSAASFPASRSRPRPEILSRHTFDFSFSLILNHFLYLVSFNFWYCINNFSFHLISFLILFHPIFSIRPLIKFLCYWQQCIASFSKFWKNSACYNQSLFPTVWHYIWAKKLCE